MRNRIIVVALCLLIVLSGCIETQRETAPQFMEDIFSVPITEEHVPAPSFDGISSITEFSLPEYRLDEMGHYVPYEGGEMHLPYSFVYSGNKLSEYGLAIMLFLDGQLQPFRIGESDSLQNVHILYPEETNGSKTVTIDLIFIPISGNSGDTLDLTIISRQYPDWKWDQNEVGSNENISQISTRLKLFYTPPESTRPVFMAPPLDWSSICTDDPK